MFILPCMQPLPQTKAHISLTLYSFTWFPQKIELLATTLTSIFAIFDPPPPHHLSCSVNRWRCFPLEKMSGSNSFILALTFQFWCWKMSMLWPPFFKIIIFQLYTWIFHFWSSAKGWRLKKDACSLVLIPTSLSLKLWWAFCYSIFEILNFQNIS